MNDFIANHIIEYLNIPEEGSPCVLILKNGREHNMVVESAKQELICGHSALIYHFCLFGLESSNELSILIDNAPTVSRVCHAKGNRVVLETSIAIKSAHKMIVQASEISALELLEIPYFERNPRVQNTEGQIEYDVELLLSKITNLSEYYTHGQFATNVIVQPPANFEIVKPFSLRR